MLTRILLAAILFSATAGAQNAIEILQAKCIACHGATQMSGLDLRQRDAMLKGGARGPAIKPGHAEESLLYQAAAHTTALKMPPGSKAPLPAQELAILKKWIEAGAPWAEDGVTATKVEPSWWSLKPVRRPPVPKLAPNPIDAFILAKLEEKGLKPAPRADKRALLRRAYFDLTGLPPTPEQQQRFLSDSRSDAWEKLIDELLASPRYGERWARHWLDVVRYADSAGFEGDVFYPNAWRYRDYVIKSLNEDKPYDRFVQEQVAGDELWPDNLDLGGFYDVPLEKLEHMEARVGTTLYTFGPEIQESHLDGGRLRYERLTDAVDTTAAAFMGVSLQCARCHDHKFDPFSQKDYFGLQAVFASSQPVLIPVVTGMSATHRDESYHWMLALDEARTAYRLLEKTVKDRVIAEKKKQFPPATLQAYEIPAEKRTPEEAELAAPLIKAYNEIKIEEFFSEEERTKHRELQQRIVKNVLEVPLADGSHRVQYDGFFDLPVATVLGHMEPEMVPQTHILDRGDLGRNKAVVGPRIPAALNDGTQPEQMAAEPAGPRYRRQLALWLTRLDHPLTARVMVNRIWQEHFGRGIVATTNDFGHQGQLPTHPELLDWLSAEFVANGWSMKSLHRMIMLSNTYQMDSRFTDAASSKTDPENAYLWRMHRRRLEAEAVWDAIHATAGTLNLKMYGRPVMPPLSTPEIAALRIKPAWVTPGDPAEAHRRAVYIVSRRNFSFPMFDKFDRPESSTSCPRREVTTVAPQALWLLNNETSYEQARQFAVRLVTQHGTDNGAIVEAAWVAALARKPDEPEKADALGLIDKLMHTAGSSRATALTELCLTIFNLSEFGSID